VPDRRLVAVLLALSDIPLRTAPFTHGDQWLVWTEARLYADRLVLTGWGLWGHYRRRVSFEALERVEHDGEDLRLYLRDAPPLHLRMDDAARWHAAIETHRDVYEG
jgi:hypothetical protein